MPPAADPEHERFVHQALADFERPLVAFAARLLGGDLDAARDVVQETFLRLVRAQRGDVEGQFRTWLYTVCRNRALDLRRKDGRMDSLDETRAATLADAGPGPEQGLERRDELRAVLAALEALPDKQREVLRLKFQHGLSYAEIGRVTQQKTGTVGWLIHEGIRALRSRLEPDGIRGVEA